MNFLAAIPLLGGAAESEQVILWFLAGFLVYGIGGMGLAKLIDRWDVRNRPWPRHAPMPMCGMVKGLGIAALGLVWVLVMAAVAIKLCAVVVKGA